MARTPLMPTFLIIGAMKSGTSALHDWLGRHPDVFVPARKELNYFAVPHVYPDGLDGYAAHFDGATEPVRGEASPAYAMRPMYDQVPERIAAVLPDVRLLYCVRDPIERIVSNYLHAYALGFESRPIDEAVREDDRYVKVSSYAMQLAAYTPLFPASSILVVTAEDLSGRDPQSLADVCRHLGLEPVSHDLPDAHPTADKKRVRPFVYQLEKQPRVRRAVALPGVRGAWTATTRTALKPSQGKLSTETRTWLEDQLRPEVQALLPWLPAGHDGWGLLQP